MVESSSIVEVDEKKKKERPIDASIAIDVERLSQQLLSSSVVSDIDSVATTPRSSSPSKSQLMRTLSRKGIQRVVVAAEKKSAGQPTADGDTAGQQNNGVVGGEKYMIAIEGEVTGHPATPTHSGGGKRRMTAVRRPLLDPKRVLFVFATLSSIGTLVLLYFTLSMAKSSNGDLTEW